MLQKLEVAFRQNRPIRSEFMRRLMPSELGFTKKPLWMPQTQGGPVLFARFLRNNGQTFFMFLSLISSGSGVNTCKLCNGLTYRLPVAVSVISRQDKLNQANGSIWRAQLQF